jgi:hypothetical protein
LIDSIVSRRNKLSPHSNEIAENLLPNSHLVAAGFVAVNRAQEYGYAFVNGTP